MYRIIIMILLLVATLSCTTKTVYKTRLLTGEPETQAAIDSLQQQIEDCEFGWKKCIEALP